MTTTTNPPASGTDGTDGIVYQGNPLNHTDADKARFTGYAD
jgi:hypothetical protein